METEQQIVEQLKQNITPPPDNVLRAAPETPVNPINGQATIAPEYKLDEMAQYKLHDYFGEQYRDSDEVKRQQTQYIYEEVAKLIDTSEYGFVIAKIRDLERIIGITSSENRLYKLYQWMKLERVRRNVDAEMGAITNG
jgi:hypothetical protein